MADKTHKTSFGDWTEIFRSGTHTSSNGVTANYSHADLDQIAANHSENNAAPIVIGHPKHNDPAFGWTSAIKRSGDSLLAKFKQVQPAFSAAVDSGSYKKRSVRLKKGENGLMLEHVGYLGAKAPAVPLDVTGRNYSSNDDDGEVFDFEMDAYTPSKTARLFRRFREFLISEFDVEKADQVVPEYEIESLADHATEIRNQNRDDTAKPIPSFSTPDNEGDDMSFTQEQMDAYAKTKIDKALAAAQTDFSASEETLQGKLDAEIKKNQRADFTAALEPLRAKGIVVPADEGILEFMQSIDNAGGGDDGVFEFTSGEDDKAKTVKFNPREWFLDYVKRRQPMVEFGETDFGGEINKNDAAELAKAASDYQAAEKDKGFDITVTQAMAHVTKGGKS